MEFLSKAAQKIHEYFVPSPQNSFRPHSLRRDFLVSIIAVVCVVEGFLATSLMLESKVPQFSAAVLQGALISLTNSARADAHEEALVENPQLTSAAQAKADDMARKGYFSHVGPDGAEPWVWIVASGYDYAYAGENLAAHFYDSSDVVDAWLASPSHRANILKRKYTEIGIGVAHGKYQGVDTVFVVQFFGVSKAALGIAPETQTAASGTVKSTAAEVPVETTSPSSVNQDKVTVAESPLPIVEGRSTTQIPSLVSRLLSSPGMVALWILFGLLAMIAVSILLAFFIRMHIQPVDLLINGLVVAAFVLTVIATNSYFFTAVDTAGSEAAAVEAFLP